MAGNSARRPRLAVVVSSDRRRGAEVFGETLATGLADRGWDTRLLALASTGTPPRIEAEPVAAVARDAMGRLDRVVVTGLRRTLVEWRPDLVLANGGPAVQYSTVAVRTMRHRPRLVVTSIGDPMFWVRSRGHARMRSLILAGADRVYSVAAATTGPLIEQLGVDPAKVRVAPTGVPDRFFAVEPEGRGPSLRVVVVGALSPEKDPLAAVDILAAAASAAPVEARFVGDGPLAGAVAAAVSGHLLGNRVKLLGPVADIVPHLAWSDVLLLTSRSEGLPGVVIEAAAAGVPSVVYDVGGCAEAVIDGETGVVLTRGDRDGAVAALVALAGDRERLAAMGERARRHAGDRYRLTVAVDRYHELLTDELGDDRHPGGEGP